MEFTRRMFMKIAALTGTVVATGDNVQKMDALIPYVVPPERLSPVVWHTIATTCRECPAGCGMHVRYRDGRITKAEGNPLHPVNYGGLCPRGQSAIQGVYDPDRIKDIMHREQGGPFYTESRDKAITEIVGRLQRSRGRVAIISRLETGALEEIMSEFLKSFGSNRLLFFEPFNYEPLRKANLSLFGLDVVPHYSLDKCDYLISFGADFLESWISNVQFAHQFAKMHELKNGKIGRFDYVGPRLSMTAVNADNFILVPQGKEKNVALALLKIMHEEHMTRAANDSIRSLIGSFDIRSVVDSHLSENDLRMMARRFAASGSAALAGPVGAAGKEAEELAIVINLLNFSAGNFNTSIDLSRPHALSKTVGEVKSAKFLEELSEDDVLIIHKANPVYARPDLIGNLRKPGMIVYLGTMLDETAKIADWFIPVSDDLESWGDYEPYAGIYSLMQPTMQSPAESHEAGDLFMSLAEASQKVLRRKSDGSPIRTTYDWLRTSHQSNFIESWETSFRRGGTWSEFEKSTSGNTPQLKIHDFSFEETALHRDDPYSEPVPAKAGNESVNRDSPHSLAKLWLWPSIMLFDGRVSNRGWLQEAPEPVSANTWGSWIDIHPQKAARLTIKPGDMIELTSEGNQKIEAPARVTEDVAENTVALALGQGHTALGKTAADRGANGFILFAGRSSESFFGRVSIRKTGRHKKLNIAIAGDDQHGRELMRWQNVEEASRKKGGQKLILPLTEGYSKSRDLYPPHKHRGHRWAMAIDLQRCIGCGACAVACYAENNIAVVGDEEVRRGRQMAWLRVIPYRHPEDSRRIGWLPMLCQHCDSAPCEPVCPVFASVHNEEGLNSQIYNRCIGTRYCSNNCPYKVRRFNWLNYKWLPPLHWQLNPEVTVRSRGVMEKCTFCIQRIRNAEYLAKRENRRVGDGEIKPACLQSCPAKVFTFGDLMDPESEVSKITRHDPRGYHILEELNTKPAITYLYRIQQKRG